MSDGRMVLMLRFSFFTNCKRQKERAKCLPSVARFSSSLNSDGEEKRGTLRRKERNASSKMITCV